MADFALECSHREVEHYDRYKDASLATQYEEGIIDEYGSTIGNPSSIPWANVSVGGLSVSLCPSCDSTTVRRTGPYGAFTGCSSFPKCNWSK